MEPPPRRRSKRASRVDPKANVTTGVPIAPRQLSELAARHGGALANGASGLVRRLVPVKAASAGDLAPLLAVRYLEDAIAARARGALLLVDEALLARAEVRTLAAWIHPRAGWALASLLETADAPELAPVIGEGCTIAASAVILPRVRIGNRVTVGPGAVVGAPGFGFTADPDGVLRPIPQLGGVVIEDDVHIGALCTIACGTLGPTILRRGVKLDAQVHVGHNCEVGENTVIAAQSGLAGSVIVGRGVLMGGQVGIADHLRIGDGARIAAKSGVIGDVPAGGTVAGYPAVERGRWLRGLAEMYRLVAARGDAPDTAPDMSVHAELGTPSRTPPPVSIHPAAIIRRQTP
ncbi:MAG: UDP-3-O-(3-hydroxymyristoyl)glucosamine N-acyltransferase [Deltaproteobacteria bacterium]|nr:UDP-3-O-(3-hydroxymyristoyl)glucosamine N-acyltransferase [Deltaproteobacteria bacterium]